MDTCLFAFDVFVQVQVAILHIDAPVVRRRGKVNQPHSGHHIYDIWMMLSATKVDIGSVVVLASTRKDNLPCNALQ